MFRNALRAAAPLASSSLARPTLRAAPRAAARVTVAVPQRRSYHEKVIDHYENPRNVGNMNKADEDVGTGLVGAPACGDVMKLQIRVDGDGKIIDTKFKTFGCGSAIASSSYITEYVKGMTLDEAAQVKNTVIAKELSLPPVKLHCSLLAEDAIKSAIKDYQQKRAKRIAQAQAASAASQPQAQAAHA